MSALDDTQTYRVGHYVTHDITVPKKTRTTTIVAIWLDDHKDEHHIDLGLYRYDSMCFICGKVVKTLMPDPMFFCDECIDNFEDDLK